MKKCFKCHQIKPLSDYYKHPRMGDGHLNKCKSCTKKDSVSRREINLQNPLWVEWERDRCRRKSHKYNGIWLARNPMKRKSQNTLNNAVRDGRIMKPNYCTSCFKTGVTIHGHHHDYSKPLDVEWLCAGCHGKRHRAEKKGVMA